MPPIIPGRGPRAALARGHIRAGVLVRSASLFGTAASALQLERIVKVTLSKPGSGRRYGSHVASAPGEPPAVDEGNLRRSIGRELVGDTWRVGTGEDRASALEFGHVYGNGRVLAPRPYMRPSARILERDHGGIIAGMVVAGRQVAVGW